MDECDIGAIRQLNAAYDRVMLAMTNETIGESYVACRTLVAATRHLAYPDRARYPKVRYGTKRNPVEVKR